jgi:hypothetical protein
MPTSDDQGPAPTEQELEAEDRRRSEVTVQDLLDMDLADPETPSRRVRDVSPAAGFDDRPDPGRVEGMEIEGLRDWQDPDERPRHAKDTDDLPPL